MLSSFEYMFTFVIFYEFKKGDYFALNVDSANENAARANKKTIRPEDVIEAAKELEFGAFVPQLQAALQGEQNKILHYAMSSFFRSLHVAHNSSKRIQ